MELTKKQIHMNREKGRAESQITLDDDFNVPDTKPDVLRLIQDQGTIRVEEINVTPGHVWVKGVLNFQLLYRSDGQQQRIHNMTGELPFQESLSLDGVNEYDTAAVSFQIEDLSVSIINSRKLSIRAVVQLTAVVQETCDQELVTGAWRQEGVEVLEGCRTVLQLFQGSKDKCRLKEDIVLPSNKPNIRELLWRSVQLRNIEFRLGENRLIIKGEALVFVLYLGQEEEDRLQWMEVPLPFSMELELAGVNEDMVLEVSYETSGVELEPKPDYDGEERILHLEMVLDLDLKIYQEEQITTVDDLYAVNCQLRPEFEPATLERLLIRNNAKCRTGERVVLEENQERILQLCASEGSVWVDQVEVLQDGLQVEGSLRVRLLYVTPEDVMPLASLQVDLPFHHTIEAPGIDHHSRYGLDASLDQLTVVMLDSAQVEVKAVVGLSAIVFQGQPLEKLVGVTEEPLDQEALQASPGIIGYIGREGDRLWDIAKENYTTIEDIQEANQITQDRLKEGDKILIIKTVGA